MEHRRRRFSGPRFTDDELLEFTQNATAPAPISPPDFIVDVTFCVPGETAPPIIAKWRPN
jgi:hypothetical protein